MKRLGRAEKLTSGLADEQVHTTSTQRPININLTPYQH